MVSAERRRHGAADAAVGQPQTAVWVLDGSLSEVAVSETVPEAEALVALVT